MHPVHSKGVHAHVHVFPEQRNRSDCRETCSTLSVSVKITRPSEPQTGLSPSSLPWGPATVNDKLTLHSWGWHEDQLLMHPVHSKGAPTPVHVFPEQHRCSGCCCTSSRTRASAQKAGACMSSKGCCSEGTQPGWFARDQAIVPSIALSGNAMCTILSCKLSTSNLLLWMSS